MDQINILEKEIFDLRRILHEKETELERLKSEWTSAQNTNNGQYPHDYKIRTQIGDKLPKWAIERYSRQILLPNIGVAGQEALCSGRVLVVGAGGLACPAVVYLAGAGVGEVGILDYDTVDVTNIHRQFLHGERDQHRSKAESAANKLRSLNSHIKVTPYNVQLDSSNALTIARDYDIILDCSDNVPTRYLLNDTCVLLKKPLVSGSALKMEGQLTIYGYRGSHRNEKVTSGPCYRCVFPSPPPAAAVGSCSANGVAGPVPGAIGALQALEAIKYLVGQSREQLLVERMLLFDGEDMTFRTVKLRPRSASCAACGDSPTITHLGDYEAFCQAQAKEKNQESRLKSEVRQQERAKRMSGRAYYGFRTGSSPGKWVQDVPRQGRSMRPPCCSAVCSKGTSKKCPTFDQSKREAIFSHFWTNLDWRGKRLYVRSLIDSVPVTRRRTQLKGEVSRKTDSKLYHLMYGEERLPVCRVMFLNTLGIKETMVRCWLLKPDKPKTSKTPLKSLSVDTYIDNLPKTHAKCPLCATNITKYISIDNIKNMYQLYNLYVKQMKSRSMEFASRKTFSKVFSMKNDLDLDILPPEQRSSAKQLLESIAKERHLVVDVRSEAEFNMCKLDGSTNMPIEKLTDKKLEHLLREIRSGNQVTLLCRRGNDSQIVAQKLLEALEPNYRGLVKDLAGGLHSWAKDGDQEFPIY